MRKPRIGDVCQGTIHALDVNRDKGSVVVQLDSGEFLNVPLHEVSWTVVANLNHLQIGQRISVKVQVVPSERTGNFYFGSIRETLKNPWVGWRERMPSVGEVIEVEIEVPWFPGRIGLCRARTCFENTRDNVDVLLRGIVEGQFQVGERLHVTVNAIDEDMHRLWADLM